MAIGLSIKAQLGSQLKHSKKPADENALLARGGLVRLVDTLLVGRSAASPRESYVGRGNALERQPVANALVNQAT